MPITQTQIQTAKNKQDTAAHDRSPQVRLVAGPGTGKSFAIQERVLYLLNQQVLPDAIYVVSFTRASALELRKRIHKYCLDKGRSDGEMVRVSTLHSLALRTLAAAGLLTAYPASPQVLDQKELEWIFDAEFAEETGYTPARCKEIRKDFEAFWSTNVQTPPPHAQPTQPITQIERQAFLGFHSPRTQMYSCVLPGEIVRKCVDYMVAGTLDPAALLGAQHLIVDEFQDLNPSDLEFVDGIAGSGVTLFVAGDDDQSLYSFRFASPAGIQSFTRRYPNAGDYELDDCFRCTTNVLEAAKTLIASFPGSNRIPKHLRSLYLNSVPPEDGIVHRWRFARGIHEAKAIAQSCKELIDQGISPRKILILISKRDVLLPALRQAFNAENIDFESPKETGFIDTKQGRFTLALLRIVCNLDDYVAYRLILGLRSHVGASTCNDIANKVFANNLNYRDLFGVLLPPGVFSTREANIIHRAGSVYDRISRWQPTDTLQQRSDEISNIVLQEFGQSASQEWIQQIDHLPPEMTLEEMRDYLWADTDEQQAALLETVYARLGIGHSATDLLPQRVRIMTMHGAKGLSARVVFIPGLEAEILPGARRRSYPGLVAEAARMLYVSITRARAACILSYAQNRIVYGQFSNQAPSQFALYLGGRFFPRNNGLSLAEARQIAQICSAL